MDKTDIDALIRAIRLVDESLSMCEGVSLTYYLGESTHEGKVLAAILRGDPVK